MEDDASVVRSRTKREALTRRPECAPTPIVLTRFSYAALTEHEAYSDSWLAGYKPALPCRSDIVTLGSYHIQGKRSYGADESETN